MHWIIAAGTGGTKPTNSSPSLAYLWVPPAAGAALGFLVAFGAGVAGLRKSNKMPTRRWITGGVTAGPAWTAKDSWVTNISGVGGVLGTLVSSSALKSTLSSTTLTQISVLFLIFGGTAALAPVVYAATANRESSDIADLEGSVWGFLTAGGFSVTAVAGELATLGIVVWYLLSATAVERYALVAFLGLAAAFVATFSFRTLSMYAQFPSPQTPAPEPGPNPAPAPGPGPAPARSRVRGSLLGNDQVSATL